MPQPTEVLEAGLYTSSLGRRRPYPEGLPNVVDMIMREHLS
jgi:hypothetical protein